MTIWNLGSVNADLVYRLPHLPEPGETLTALGHQRGLGGKGANMSVAAVRAGSRVEHIGAVGSDGAWMKDRLNDYGVGVTHLTQVDTVSGHAIIALDQAGENQIIIVAGANRAMDDTAMDTVLAGAEPGDIAVCQNETSAQVGFARAAKARGLRTAYAAAPFTVDAVREIMADIDLLVLNAVEAAQLEAALERRIDTLPVADIVITLGADGCRWIDTVSGETRDFPAPKVKVVDTTGAGDTFTGYLLSALDQGHDMASAIDIAARAGAVMVTRLGTADVIPTQAEIDAYFDAN
ncbi:ribokinase [Pseudooceanicola onchidii]|uniref:ribokinase n=1 Tax=Pseudooceanicola onchidii TaxID=2562279 RepID=UPI0010A9E44A|nr:ribokinase [Pseudooceanicola onchidii]